jgi:hypothetical protein
MRKLGDELARSMAQALADAEGKRTCIRVHKAEIDLKEARMKLGRSPGRMSVVCVKRIRR